MVEFQFVGDVSDLSVEHKELIANVLEERGFKNVNIDVQPVGKTGDNYIASIKRITVENNGEIFNIIAKVAPKDDMMRVLGNTTKIYTNEHVMYTEVLKKFTELEKAAGVPEEERLRYPACYGALLEAPNEIILLEDLEESGFKILGRFTSLTDENVRLVLKDFAKLHSLSYVLKNQEPKTFETIYKSLVNFWALMEKASPMMMWMAKVDEDVQILLDNEKYKNVVKNATVQMCSHAAKLAKIEAKSKYSVIQQGDAWTNNIMFKIENDRTVECCMIDYQAVRLSSPVADIHYMIFNCTDYDTRAKHYYDWIDYYYSQLEKNLFNFGLKANFVYPRDRLDADLRTYAKISLGQAIMLASVIVRETENAAKIGDVMKSKDNESFIEMSEHIKLSTTDLETIKKFKDRLEGVVDSFTEFGYL